MPGPPAALGTSRLNPEGSHPEEQKAGSPPILVVPSREEGFGLILLEGMARGFPIVATRAGGIPEVVRHEVEALLVPPGDPAALSRAILRLIGDPELRRRLVEAGRRRVLDFPLEKMVASYHALYRRVLEGAH